MIDQTGTFFDALLSKMGCKMLPREEHNQGGWEVVLLLAQQARMAEAIAKAVVLLDQSTYLLIPSADCDKELELAFIAASIASLGSIAISYDENQEALVELFCKATDFGFHQFAYNAACGTLESAQSPDDYRKAESYFKIAIATAQDDSVKAAALVNYCPIIRDGLINGVQDLEGAIDLYEKSAKLGMVTAMYDLANVCAWQVSHGDNHNAERAAFWLNAMLAKTQAGGPFLEMDNPDLFPEMVAQGYCWLAQYNLDQLIKDPSLDKGIEYLRKSIETNPENSAKRLWRLECAYAHKLLNLNPPPSLSTPALWRTVLTALGWKLEAPMKIDGQNAYRMAIRDSELDLNLVITADVFLPDAMYKDLFFLDISLKKQGVKNYLIVSPYVLCHEKDDKCAIPMAMMSGGERGVMGLSLIESPDEQFRAALNGRKLLDSKNMLHSQIFPMIMNAYFMGLAPDEYETSEIRWVNLGKWQLTFPIDLPEFYLMK